MKENDELLISIIVPIYNVESYLYECINSIINQSYRNIEVILVDDGSTDGSSTICDYYELQDTRIKVIHKINEGVSAARIEGFEASTGNFIGFVDGDDIVAIDMFENLVELIRKYQADIACCNRFVFIDASEIIKMKAEYVEEHIEYVYLSDEAVWQLFKACEDKDKIVGYELWNKIYKRENIENILNEDYKELLPMFYGDDIFLTPLILHSAKKIAYTCEQLYYYRQRTGSYIHSAFNMNKLKSIKVKRLMLAFYTKWDMLDVYKIALREYGNSLIKAYIEIGKMGSRTEELGKYLEEILCEYQLIYKKLILISKSNVIHKLSFLVFRINPRIWSLIAGDYLLKVLRKSEKVIKH